MIHHGDLFDVLPTLEPESVDACVTDPPYGIGFMGKEWDSFLPSTAAKKAGLRQYGRLPRWKENNPNLKGRTVNGAISASQIEYDRGLNGQRAFQEWTEKWSGQVMRVLKPGAHLVVCGAPRSHHRMMCGLEDAGFEIRDCLAWLFGQGFPKSLNLGDGWGTALKPGHEPIVLARKPFKGSVTANVERFGVGGLNISGCRIGDSRPAMTVVSDGEPRQFLRSEGRTNVGIVDEGRWPANVLLDEEAAALLDEQSGESESTGGLNPITTGITLGTFEEKEQRGFFNYGDRGGASRFFYVAKPSREERDLGCEGLAPRSGGEVTDRKDGSAGLNNPRAGAGRTGGSRNFHPTVKPLALMRWLVRLVTPAGGIVLDPFGGSGTTGMACAAEGFDYILIEREADYIPIIEARIRSIAPLFTETGVRRGEGAEAQE